MTIKKCSYSGSLNSMSLNCMGPLKCGFFSINTFDDLSIGVSGVVKSPTIVVLLSMSPFMSVSVCLDRKTHV